MIDLDKLRADVARAIGLSDVDIAPGHENCPDCLELQADAFRTASAAIAEVLKAVADHADGYVGKGQDIGFLAAELETLATTARGGA